MAQGEFTKQEAQRTEEAVNELFDAIFFDASSFNGNIGDWDTSDI